MRVSTLPAGDTPESRSSTTERYAVRNAGNGMERESVCEREIEILTHRTANLPSPMKYVVVLSGPSIHPSPVVRHHRHASSERSRPRAS